MKLRMKTAMKQPLIQGPVSPQAFLALGFFPQKKKGEPTLKQDFFSLGTS